MVSSGCIRKELLWCLDSLINNFLCCDSVSERLEVRALVIELYF